MQNINIRAMYKIIRRRVCRFILYATTGRITRFSILSEQIKAGNNSNKIKNEIRQILYTFCISTINSPKKFTII